VNTRSKILGILLGLLASFALLALRKADPPVVANLRAAGFDTLQVAMPRKSPPQPVTVIDIDEASLHEVGQWPWPRDRLALLVTHLKDLGASAVVFDIIFPEPDRLSPAMLASNPALHDILAQSATAIPDYDLAFANSIKEVPTVVAAAATSGASSTAFPQKASFAETGLPARDAPARASGLISNLPAINEAAQGLGLINIDLAGNGGVARTLPLLWSDGQRYYPGLVLEALRLAQGENTIVVNASPTTADAITSIRVGQVEIPTSEQGSLPIYYRHDAPDLYVSAAQLLRDGSLDALRPRIEGHIVLIGTSATGLLDTRTSSLGEAIPGVSVHAQALEQILSGQFLHRPEGAAGAEFLFVALAGLLFSTLANRLKPWPLLATLLTALLSLAAITMFCFVQFGLLIDFTFPLMACVTIFLVTLAFKLLVTDRQGRMLRNAFAHYVAGPVLADIERNPQALKLGGEQREITVMFADIRNFTPMSEKLKPDELVSRINTILTACTEAVISENGTLDKYIGDAVMAFWNAPLPVEEHQYRAACAALKIQDELERLNKDENFSSPLKQAGLWPISIRIGLASGPATVGNMGSANRFDYSALGETVNIAARAEQACKEIEADIILAGPLFGRTQDLACLDAGRITMRGKGGRISAHAIFGMHKDEAFKQADMGLYAFQSGTRMHVPRLPEAYQRFIAHLPARKADYAET
jgi:adenylate cyclase